MDEIEKAREELHNWASDISALNLLCEETDGVEKGEEEHKVFMMARGLARKNAEKAAQLYIEVVESRERATGFGISVRS
jgi:hypothetical protein